MAKAMQPVDGKRWQDWTRSQRAAYEEWHAPREYGGALDKALERDGALSHEVVGPIHDSSRASSDLVLDDEAATQSPLFSDRAHPRPPE